MTLDSLARGCRATIIAVDWAALPDDEGKRLRLLGIDEGAEVEVAHRGVFATRDPLAIRVGAMTVALRRAHAAAMTVQAA
ncbi:ferrous iron transport protein A [Leptolyngbya sp. 15MV]|nr:ferrous iron transport protein A [Leptolyngbya sp. 15MV]